MNEAEIRMWAWEQAHKWSPMEKVNNMHEHEKTADALVRWVETGNLYGEQSDER